MPNFIIPNYHPMMVHFTIGLTLTSLGMLLLSYIVNAKPVWQKECLIVSRWCLWLAAIASLFTLVAGFHAYYTVAHDTISHKMMTIHRNWGIATFVLIWLTTLFSIMLYVKKKQPKMLFTLILTVTTVFVLITGWYGAELVFRYGLGVKSLPKVEVAGHQHSQAASHNNEASSADKHNHTH